MSEVLEKSNSINGCLSDLRGSAERETPSIEFWAVNLYRKGTLVKQQNVTFDKRDAEDEARLIRQELRARNLKGFTVKVEAV